MKTVRVFPVFAGRLDGTPSSAWDNAENALEPNDKVAIAHILPGSRQSALQYLVFETEIPTRATIEGMRMITRAAVTDGSVREFQVARYQYFWELPDGSEPPRWTNIGPWNEHGESMETVINDCSALQVGLFNGQIGIAGHGDEMAPLSIRNRFEVAMRLYREHTYPVPSQFEIEWVAWEFDYTLPETPWSANLFIQGKPMTTQKIKQGSNTPFIQISVSDATGQPLDLRGCTLSLSAKSLENEFGGEVEITDAINGKAVYRWSEGDTDFPGLYRVELVAHWLDGSIVKIPFDRFSLIEVVPSIS